MAHDLKTFEPSKAGAYDAGSLIVLFDGRQSGPPAGSNKTSMFTSLWLHSMYRLGWPGLQRPDLEPGNLRLVWYTHAGNEGAREFPLWKAYNVKEMFDSLAEGGFRPLILGWSVENPFPMIGGSEPPPEPKREKPKTAATWSNTVSGHSDRDGSTPHDRVMAIIERDEQQEAERRKDDVEKASTEKSGLMGAYAAV